METKSIVVRHVDRVEGVGCREVLEGVAAIPELISDVYAAIAAAGMAPIGGPIAIYRDPDAVPESIDIEIIVPVARIGVLGPTPAGRELTSRAIPAADAAVTSHVGPYETIRETYEASMDWIASSGLRVAGPVQEIYLTGPDEPGPPVTEIRIPVVHVGV
jgi:AraC family transcriptional regulator